jgi:acyl-CoA synthetase (AMP-forming)/AMP-acid ligase II
MYTFAQPLSRALGVAAGSSAVVCQDSRRTYAELDSRCRRLAGAMRKLGVAPHDRVGVIALNSDRYLELYLGLPAAGYVLVPVNSRLAPAEMRAILEDAGVSVLFADSDYPGAAGGRARAAGRGRRDCRAQSKRHGRLLAETRVDG